MHKTYWALNLVYGAMDIPYVGWACWWAYQKPIFPSLYPLHFQHHHEAVQDIAGCRVSSPNL